MIISQNGRVISEEYMYGGAADRFIDIKSASKSIFSTIITRAPGMTSRACAQNVLFTPLAIDRVIWAKDPQGYPIDG